MIEINIQCYDDDYGKDSLIGEVLCTPMDLLERVELTLKDPRQVVTGTIQVVDVREVHEMSFLDYIEGGTNVSLMVAIDFTASNRNPRQMDSLHY